MNAVANLSSRAAPGRRIAAGILLLACCALLFELGCQVLAFAVVYPRFDAMRNSHKHFYRLSANPILGYELRPFATIAAGERTLHINRWGIRGDDDDLGEGKRKIAVLGDSVAFGVKHSQERTISALLQQELDPSQDRIKVLNFGVAGYALAELVEFLKVKDAIYDVDDVLYLLNLNDFSRRSSVYEGADNGLYRTYHRPLLKSPWLVRKAIYRFHKRGPGGSAHWYEWFFAGNEQIGYSHLRDMAAYAAAHGIDLSVVLLPSGRAYTDNGYALTELHERVGALLREQGIPYRDPTGEFGAHPERYFDETDHLRDAGNVLTGRLMGDFVRERDAAEP